MTLRLVLVSLVAALGLTIPGGPTIESWVATTQNWMNARFADWDTRNPQETDYVIIADHYDPALTAHRRIGIAAKTERMDTDRNARPALALTDSLPTPAPVVRPVSFVRHRTNFMPIPAMTDPPGIAFADDLNRRNDGIGKVPSPIVRRMAKLENAVPFGVAGTTYAMMASGSSKPVRTAGFVQSVAPAVLAAPARPQPAAIPARPAAARFSPITVAENLYTGIAYDLNRLNEGIDIKVVKPVRLALAKISAAPQLVTPKIPAPGSPAPATAIASFGPMVESENLYFAGPLEPVVAVVTAKAPGEHLPAPLLTPVSTLDPGDDLFVETLGSLFSEGDGFAPARPSTKAAALEPVATPAPNVTSGPARAVAGEFPPIEVGDEMYVGVAHELNRRNDGIGVPVAVAARVKKLSEPAPPTTRELARAVKLTGEAVYAWVSVLTGPALVTVCK